MRIQSIILSLILAFIPIITIAGGGHDHGHGHSHGPATEEQAINVATNVVSNIADKGIIDQSWKGVTASSAEIKDFDGQQEWVVLFNNDQVADAAKQNLYIFLTIEGRYLAANYTGK